MKNKTNSKKKKKTRRDSLEIEIGIKFPRFTIIGSLEENPLANLSPILIEILRTNLENSRTLQKKNVKRLHACKDKKHAENMKKMTIFPNFKMQRLTTRKN